MNPNEQRIKKWFCRVCWQEGERSLNADMPVERSSEIKADHARQVRGFGGKCAGDIHEQVKSVDHRVKPDPMPSLDFDASEPIRIP